MRFNVGDRIKNISSDFMEIKRGDIVTVESYDADADDYIIKNVEGRWLICPEEWELVESKIATTYPKVNCSIEIELENKSITLTIEEARVVRVMLGEVLK